MYWQSKMSHDDKVKVFKWASYIGVVMTLCGWAIFALTDSRDMLIVPTTYLVICLSLLMMNRQYDEFHRALTHAGAIGGMMAVLLWTAFLPIIADVIDREMTAFPETIHDLRFTFYVAASGFFIGLFAKRLRGEY